MAYLADKYNLPENWHPSSSSSSGQAAAQQQLQCRAVYESAVHWQHLTMRGGCMRLVFHTVIGERLVVSVASCCCIPAYGLMQGCILQLPGKLPVECTFRSMLASCHTHFYPATTANWVLFLDLSLSLLLPLLLLLLLPPGPRVFKVPAVPQVAADGLKVGSCMCYAVAEVVRVLAVR
jgi:hypothetical protein